MRTSSVLLIPQRILATFQGRISQKTRRTKSGAFILRVMSSQGRETETVKEDPAVTRFREYLRIKTVQPDPDYGTAVIYLERLAKEMGLEYTCIQPVENRPIMIMTWKGSKPELPSVLLNSHMDVVPVFAEYWTHNPFAAIKDSKGDIYARGSQDMKCVGSQYMEAVRRLKESGIKLMRTVHMSFVPDEEIGGQTGMLPLTQTKLFKNMNVGFALDEGLANPGENFKVYYGQRSGWWVRVDIKGNPGHASQFIPNTAARKMKYIVDRILELRDKEENRLADNPSLKLGDVITPNLTKLDGGVQYNVVPAEMTVGFDVRIPPKVDLVEFEDQIKSWCQQAGSDVSYNIFKRGDTPELTSIDSCNHWWTAFQKACNIMNMKIDTEVFPAGTDSKYLRRIGIPALGFSPMNHTPILLHDHDEKLNENIFLKGIQIYQQIITELGNSPG